MSAAACAAAVLLLCLCSWPAVTEGQSSREPAAAAAAAAAAGARLRAQLRTVFTGSSSARVALRRQLETARRYLRRTPPVSAEPPPHTTELCRMNGHSTCERHTVQTDDGYLLTLVRIAASSPGAVPALLMHGDLASSDSFMMRKDNSNFGTVLHEAGYDVWLGNFRGNTHSRDHVTLNNTDPKFWSWSWHEMGLYDIPAMVDYILKRTGFSDLHLLGHSMASSAMLVTLSERPQYNAKVRLASWMSPSIRMRGFIRRAFDAVFSRYRNRVDGWLRRNDISEIWPRAGSLHYIGDLFCMDDSPLIDVCYSMFEEVLGKGHLTQRLPDYLATFGAYHPAGTSFRCLEHYGAINLSGRFRPLGQGVNDPNPPPDYNLTAVSAPVALYFSLGDGIIGPKDVERLAKALPRLEEKYLISLKQFNHVDYMWAKDARGLLYERMIKKMKEFDVKGTAESPPPKPRLSNKLR